MQVTDKEKLEVENLLKLIKRAYFKEFLGVEALALARAHVWLESLIKEDETKELKTIADYGSVKAVMEVTPQLPVDPPKANALTKRRVKK